MADNKPAKPPTIDFDPAKWLKENRTTTTTHVDFAIHFEKSIAPHGNAICHASALGGSVSYSRRTYGDILAITTGLQIHDGSCTKEAGNCYFDYILDPEGMYKSILKDVTIHRIDGEYRGITINDTVVPTLVLCNFLVATRLPWERGNNAQLFFELIKVGMRKPEAWFIANSVQSWDRKTNKLTMPAHCMGHCAVAQFDDAIGEPKIHNLKNMEAGIPYFKDERDVKNMYRTASSNFQLNNSVWFNEKDEYPHPFMTKMKKREIEVYRGNFPYTPQAFKDFPMAIANGHGGNRINLPILTINDLMEVRTQWSPLK